jgi:hypothetical protein
MTMLCCVEIQIFKVSSLLKCFCQKARNKWLKMLMTPCMTFFSLETFCLQLNRQDLKSDQQCNVQEVTGWYLLFYAFF